MCKNRGKYGFLGTWWVLNTLAPRKIGLISMRPCLLFLTYTGFGDGVIELLRGWVCDCA